MDVYLVDELDAVGAVCIIMFEDGIEERVTLDIKESARNILVTTKKGGDNLSVSHI